MRKELNAEVSPVIRLEAGGSGPTLNASSPSNHDLMLPV